MGLQVRFEPHVLQDVSQITVSISINISKSLRKSIKYGPCYWIHTYKYSFYRKSTHTKGDKGGLLVCKTHIKIYS